MDNLMTVKDLAKMLNISNPTVYYFIREKGMPHLRIGGKNGKGIRFERNRIVDWIKENNPRYFCVQDDGKTEK